MSLTIVHKINLGLQTLKWILDILSLDSQDMEIRGVQKIKKNLFKSVL